MKDQHSKLEIADFLVRLSFYSWKLSDCFAYAHKYVSIYMYMYVSPFTPQSLSNSVCIHVHVHVCKTNLMRPSFHLLHNKHMLELQSCGTDV